MIIRSIKTGKEIEVMADTIVPDGFEKIGQNTSVNNATNVALEKEETNATNVALADETAEESKKAKKGAKRDGKD